MCGYRSNSQYQRSADILRAFPVPNLKGILMSRLFTAMLVVAFLGVAGFVLPVIGEDQPKEPPKTGPQAKPDVKAEVMKKKLMLAQKVLEGLALEDFDKIKTAADDLVTVRQHAAFMVSKTAKYEGYTNDFQKHLEELQKSAKKKNIEAASLAYVEMTLTCVRCHQYVRDEKIGAAPLPSDPARTTNGG
jgi:hypothetical protein